MVLRVDIFLAVVPCSADWIMGDYGSILRQIFYPKLADSTSSSYQVLIYSAIQIWPSMCLLNQLHFPATASHIGILVKLLTIFRLLPSASIFARWKCVAVYDNILFDFSLMILSLDCWIVYFVDSESILVAFHQYL